MKMNTKVCSRCKQEKPLTEFYESKRDGFRSRCKLCHKVDVKEYFNRLEVKERRRIPKKIYGEEYRSRPGMGDSTRDYIREYMREYRKNPGVKLKIWGRSYTNNAVMAGKIKREPCAFCGGKKTEAHHLDYGQPWMVMWLCPSCHRKVHQKLEG